MSTSIDQLGETGSDNNFSLIAEAASLLVDRERSVRHDRSFPGQKITSVILTAATPDFDADAGTGARVSYDGTIDRATLEPSTGGSWDPIVMIEGAHESVEIPVVNNSAMVPDEARLAEMRPDDLTLATNLAARLLNGMDIQIPAES